MELRVAGTTDPQTRGDANRGGGGGGGMAKGKGAKVLVKLLSAAGTGFFYVKAKNPRRTPHRLEFRKYDPVVRRHVLFSETKLR
eukprot:SM000168S02613  [mRNA]  locus=s168:156018:156345:- [translate_table: standard]